MKKKIRLKPVIDKGRVALACYYPFDTEKMTVEEFSQTQEYRDFMALGAPDMKSNGLFETNIDLPKDLEESIYQVCPDDIKILIDKYKGRIVKSKRLPNIVILHGDSGTGKSELISLISKKTDRDLTLISSPLLENSYIDSQRINLREIVNPLVNQQNSCLVGIEDAEYLKTSALNSICEFAVTYPNILFVLTALDLTQIENWFLDLIDRLGVLINVPLPDLNARKKIIDYLVKSRKINSNIDNSVSENTAGFDIFDLQRLVKNSCNKTREKVRDKKIDKKEFETYFDITNDDIEKYKTDRSSWSSPFKKRMQQYNEKNDENDNINNNNKTIILTSCIGLVVFSSIIYYIFNK